MILNDLGIDLGTANTLIYLRGCGIVVNEPSIIAVNNETGRLRAIGKEASEMAGREPRNITITRPVNQSVITDLNLAGNLLKMLIAKCPQIPFLKSRIIMGVPGHTTSMERHAIVEAAYRAGAGKISIIKEIAAAALGAGLPIHELRASMIVDIGAGTTEIAVFSLSGIVLSHEIRIAGSQFDEAIMQYIEQKHRTIIGRTTAERIKIETGSAFPPGNSLSIEIKGKNKADGLPKIVILKESEVRAALMHLLVKITDAVKLVLGRIDPDLSADIAERGILLSGC
jgi:rod shape-determining protein MreB